MSVDIGTGDGLFAYRAARANSNEFFIGIDANRGPLEKISRKIYRKPAKGGLANVLFVQAGVEDLPSELDGVAGTVHVNFPWGSLLGAVAGVNGDTLRNIRDLCRPGASLRVIMGLDLERDAAEIDRLKLPVLSSDYIDKMLAANYRTAGFEIVERKVLPAADRAQLQTSWAKRLRANSSRSFVRIVARATL